MRVDQLTEHLPPEDIERPKAWTRATISPDRWMIALPDACVAELDQVVASLRAAPRPIERLDRRPLRDRRWVRGRLRLHR